MTGAPPAVRWAGGWMGVREGRLQAAQGRAHAAKTRAQLRPPACPVCCSVDEQEGRQARERAEPSGIPVLRLSSLLATQHVCNRKPTARAQRGSKLHQMAVRTKS